MIESDSMDIEDDYWHGRPSTSTTHDNVEGVHQLLVPNKRITMDEGSLNTVLYANNKIIIGKGENELQSSIFIPRVQSARNTTS